MLHDRCIAPFARFLLCCFILLVCGNLQAEIQTDVELRYGVLFPSSSLVRELYGNVLPSYQIEATVSMCGCYSLWTSLDFTKGRGNRCACDVKTWLNLYTWGLGVKGHYCLASCLEGYLGIGMTCANTHVKNKRCCFDEKVSRVSVGGIVKGGLTYALDCNWFIDLFCDYTYQPVHFERHTNVGGITTGLGIGYTF